MFVKYFNDKLIIICGLLVENFMKGFKMFYDLDNIILKGIF